MKKYIILIFIHFTICFSAYAQKILLKEDFNKFSPMVPGWSNKTRTGPDGWQTGEMYLVVGSTASNCLCFNASSGLSMRRVAGTTDCNRLGIDYNNSNNLLYGPSLDLTGHPKVILEFSSYFKQKTNGIYTEKGTIELSTDGGKNWTVIGQAIQNPNLNEFLTYYQDISSYNSFSDVRIGFRYSDGGGFLSGWAIDDVVVFEPLNKDIKLISVTPYDSLLSYTTINTGMKHAFTVFNAGIDTITQFTINYVQDNGAVKTDTIKNVSIPSFVTKTFTHTIEDTVKSTGKHKVLAWVQMDGDTVHWNDTAHISVSGAWFMPQKIVALEEGTATWNGYCIPGLVLMKQLSGAGYYTCQVSVHDNDPMMSAQTRPYSDYLFNLDQNYTPYFLLDRRVPTDAVNLVADVTKRQQYFGYADINIDPKIEDNVFKVTANIKPAVDLNGDFRAVLIITEDDVSGTGLGWEQANAYKNNFLGPMGGYENKPDPIPAKDMRYQYVARSIYLAPDGVNNLPTAMTHSQIYSTKFEAVLDPTWNKDKLRANIFLIRQADSMVINSNKILFYLGIKDKENPFANAMLYPNPSAEQTTLQFSTTDGEEVAIQIMDIGGRILINNSPRTYGAGKHEVTIGTAQLAPGLYLVNLLSEKGKRALKLQVIH